jgi:hypothetical protein
MTNANFKNYITTKFTLVVNLVEENYIELTEKAKYFEKLKVDNDLVNHLHQTFHFFLSH